MASSTFVKGMEDLSVASGDSAGFQFRAKCGCCTKVAFTSEFIPFSQPGGKGVFSKVFSKGADPAPKANSQAWADEHKKVAEAFADAVEGNFTYCPKCGKYVCEKCWNTVRDMCLNCCAQFARSAYDDPYFRQKKEEQKCAQCGAVVTGAKFCPKCGTKVIPKGTCPKCSHKVPDDAAFCPECGSKIK